MAYGKSGAVAVGMTVALLLAGCSADGDGPAGGTGSPEAGPSPVDASNGAVCPFFTTDERDELILTNVPVSGSGEETTGTAGADQDEGILDECAYRGPLTANGPLEQVRVRLREGDVAELGKTLPGYKPRDEAQKGTIAFQREIHLSITNTAVCSLLAPGRKATGGNTATTVEVAVFLASGPADDQRPGDICEAMDKAAPLIEKKFPKP